MSNRCPTCGAWVTLMKTTHAANCRANALVAAAAEAQERFGDDELERFAKAEREAAYDRLMARADREANVEYD